MAETSVGPIDRLNRDDAGYQYQNGLAKSRSRNKTGRVRITRIAIRVDPMFLESFVPLLSHYPSIALKPLKPKRLYSRGSDSIFSLLAERDRMFGVGWEERVAALKVDPVSELLIG